MIRLTAGFFEMVLWKHLVKRFLMGNLVISKLAFGYISPQASVLEELLRAQWLQSFATRDQGKTAKQFCCVPEGNVLTCPVAQRGFSSTREVDGQALPKLPRCSILYP